MRDALSPRRRAPGPQELVIQFCFVVLFGVAFPLTAALALFSNSRTPPRAAHAAPPTPRARC